MIISPKSIRFDEDCIWVELSDAHTIGAPLVWFPRLLNATAEQRARFEISPFGIHWEELDEDISVEGLLSGQRDQTNTPRRVA